MTTMINIWTPFDLFRTEDIAPYITCPTLIMTGCCDAVTSCQRSYELSQLFPNATFIPIIGAGHHNVFKFKQYDEAMIKFIHG